MFPNWTGWTYIKAALFTLITFDGIFMTANVFSAATVHYATIASLLLGGAGVVVTTLSGTSMGPALVRNAPKVLAIALLLVCLSSTLSACLSTAPVVPVTPANQAQVSTCQSIASTHNGIVIGDFALGAATSSLAGVGALVSDPQTKTDLAIGAAVAGALGIAGTAVAGFTAADFANSQCSSVVGALPMARAPSAAGSP